MGLKAKAVLAIWLGLGTSADAASAWLPTEAEISNVETHLSLPKGADPLETYDRYYAGTLINGRRMIEGYLVGGNEFGKRKKGSLHIVPKLDPWIADGGCTVVTIYFDVLAKRQARAFCNGIA